MEGMLARLVFEPEAKVVDLAPRLRCRRRDLAAAHGKPQSFVSDYKNGQRRIDPLEFLPIVETLKADPLMVFAEIVERRAEAPKQPQVGRE